MTAEKGHISLYELMCEVHRRLDAAFPLPVWVAAEMSELKVNYSGHCYMELVEKGEGERMVRAKCSAVVWRSQWGAISSYFVSATGRELAAGMKVLLRATVIFHEAYGLSLQVSDIDPTYTLGEMERQRQATIARLKEDGVFDMNRMLDMPAVPQRVAVVSSRNAAGYQDFMNELAVSPYRFDVALFDSVMQGAAAEGSVVGALERVAMRAGAFDIVAVIRGGGATSDLAAFDSYRLCSHLAQFPLPVVTGIGHDKDRSVADMVSAVALKTPTAVARWLVDTFSDFGNTLDERLNDLKDLIQTIIADEKEMFLGIGLNIQILSTTFARRVESRIGALETSLPHYAAVALDAIEGGLDSLSGELRQTSTNAVAVAGRRLDDAGAAVAAHDPARILAMGFALVRNSTGQIIKTSAALKSGDIVNITLSKGSVKANIERSYGKK